MSEQKTNPNLDTRFAFEEYKLFYDSTEKVTERRLALNRWNYSICTAVLLAVFATSNWVITNPNFFAAGITIACSLSFLAILYCSLWMGQISDYKQLNNAKFEVLNQMAPRVAFSKEEGDFRTSYEPFAKEWEILKGKKEALEEVKSMNIVALNSTSIEYLVPRSIRWLFVLVIIFAIIITVLNWTVFLESLSLELKLNPGG